MSADGGRELGESLGVESRPWRLTVGRHLLERDLGWRERRGHPDGGCGLAKKDVEPPSESARHQAIAPLSGISVRCLSRAVSSPASSSYAAAAAERGS